MQGKESMLNQIWKSTTLMLRNMGQSRKKIPRVGVEDSGREKKLDQKKTQPWKAVTGTFMSHMRSQ